MQTGRPSGILHRGRGAAYEEGPALQTLWGDLLLDLTYLASRLRTSRISLVDSSCCRSLRRVGD